MNATVKINPPKLYGDSIPTKIIKYLQAHPTALRRTNGSIFAKQMCLSMRGLNEISVGGAFRRMVQDGIIDRVGGNKRHGDYKINYLHPRMPKNLIESMPEKDRWNYQNEVAQKLLLTPEQKPETKQTEKAQEVEEVKEVRKPEETEVAKVEQNDETRSVNLELDDKGKTITFTFNIVIK